MFKAIALASTLATTLTLAQFAWADGKMSMDIQPSHSRILLEATKTGNQIQGSVNTGSSPFIDLRLIGENKWQGRLGGQQIAETKVESKKTGTFEVTISALPAGVFTYSYKVKSNGDVEVSGSGPQGNLNTAGIKKSRKDVYFFNMDYSHEFNKQSEGKYSGSVTTSRPPDSGFAYLSTAGDLDPSALAKDPGLFTLLYVFPFSR